MIEVSRRGFLRGMVAGGGALTLAVTFGCGDKSGVRIAHADRTGELAANLYVTVKPDGRIALVVNKAELGQGVTTGYVTLVAEELSVPLDHVDMKFADSHPGMRASFNMQITGGSTSTKGAFVGLRHAAAAAREMLVAAAATDWRVPIRECTVANGRVAHGDHSAGYGELTRHAARMPVPEHPTLKARKDYTLVGKTDRRIDARAKVTGTAVFGIDFAVPDMVNACVIHGPVYGASPTRMSAEAARGKPGVIDVLALPFGVVVVAQKYWQARAAAREVTVEWTRVTSTDSTPRSCARRCMAPTTSAPRSPIAATPARCSHRRRPG